MSLSNYICKSAACHFDKSIAPEILVFEIIVILGVILSIFLFSTVKRKVIFRFLILSLGIFIFEFFTNPLWMNYHLGSWAYIYQDVSWLLTIGWSAIILFAMFLAEKYFNDYSELRKFILALAFVTVLGIIAESVVVNLGIRSYSPETQEATGGFYLPLLNIPLAALYYIPVFMALVISFYKFWSLFLDNKIMAPLSKSHWPRKLAISLVGILLFEFMVDPMIINLNLPEWSYIYRDISILMTGAWILIVWFAIIVIDKIIPYVNPILKFFGYVILAAVVSLPLEAFAFANNSRNYSVSTLANFSGFYIPVLHIPIEIAFAISFNLILVVSFTYYWTYYSNRVIKINDHES